MMFEKQISCFIVSDFAFLIPGYFPLIITKTTGKKSASFCNCQAEKTLLNKLLYKCGIFGSSVYCKTLLKHSRKL